VSPNQAEPARQIEIARPIVDDVRLEVTASARVRGHVDPDLTTLSQLSGVPTMDKLNASAPPCTF
jgi:hypothetical protein